MDSRPNFYYLHVDSNFDLDEKKELENFVIDAIINECGCDDYEECDDQETNFPIWSNATGGYRWGDVDAEFKLKYV